ncbi:hypothetical protein RE9425_50190 (plasmid) [Prescottella equi]|nr:hypothetical protein RE9425_50190 [Prescottella equi]
MPQNNVQLPQCAYDALEKVKADRALSRDKTVRQLLTEYIDDQHTRSGEDDVADDRLTHISTLMRHPLPAGRGQPKPGTSLVFRAPSEVIEEAKRLAFALPGQSRTRGHHDYQARPLTDAVMTAIARVQPFDDDILRRVEMPLIRQRAAAGLWRLVVAATLSGSEWEVLEAAYAEAQERSNAESIGRRPGPVSPIVRVADELKEGNQSWHAPQRSLIARKIARQLLSGPLAAENEQILYEQDPRDRRWNDLLVEYTFHMREHGIVRYEGRGAGVVWRTRRQLQLDELHKWLIVTAEPTPSGHPHALVMEPPGWKLIMPTSWRPIVRGAREPRPAGWDEHVTSGNVLEIEAGSKCVLWPTLPAPDGPCPVPRLEHVITQAKSLRPERIVEVLLRYIPDDDPDDDDREATVEATAVRYPGDDNIKLDLARPIPIPAWTAHDLGFISAATRDRLAAETTALNIERMAETIRAAGNKPSCADLMPKLRAAHDAGNLTEFKKLADEAGEDFSIARPLHFMRGTSLARQVDTGAEPATISWLAGYLVRNTTRCLELSMEETSRHAFARFYALAQGKDGTAF